MTSGGNSGLRLAAIAPILASLAALSGWGCGEDPPAPPLGPAPPVQIDAGGGGEAPPRPSDVTGSADPDAAVATGADGKDPAATPADAASPPDFPPPDTGPTAPPVLALTRMIPLSSARDVAVHLELTGTAFAPDAVVLLDGQPLATTWLSSTSISAELPALLSSRAGFSPVLVKNGAALAAARSNPSYFLFLPPTGWPEVIDFRPDNGTVGETVLIAGFNLIDQTVRISDASGRLAQSGRIGTTVGAGVVLETVEFAVPEGWQDGPIIVSNPLGSFRTKVFNRGPNLALLPGVVATASSEYGDIWTIARGNDNDLATSWFPAAGDCVSAGPPTCMQVPFYTITFPAPQTVGRIALRGNREYTTGYDFLRARFELLGSGAAVLWSGSFELPEPDRDLDIALPMPVAGVIAVRFTSERDESEDPGFAELEVFGP